jgi:N-glycosylase/DNA lyase
MEFLDDRLAWMFRRDESFEEFWAVCRRHGAMEPIAELRAGALLRSGSLFEDVVKTLCTVNCTWANTRRMVEGLCELFGQPVPGTHPAAFTFPDPESLAAASEDDLRAAKLGFRARWIHHLAVQVAGGEVDPSSWIGRKDVEILRKELLALKGVGPYAANHILMMLGHYGYIPADSEAASRLGLPPGTPTAAIERQAVDRYADWGEYAFLAYRFEGFLERLVG